MSKHTPEPWAIWNSGDGIIAAEEMWFSHGGIALIACNSKVDGRAAKANARRIVACVNACAGVDTDLLEAGELDKPTMLVIQENKDLKHRCDELLAALEGVLAVVSDSAGVAGYHLNGNIADWGEFDEINAVYTVIAKAKGITAAEVDSCCP